MELTREKIESLLTLEDDEFRLEEFRKKHSIDPENSVLYVTFNRLIKERALKRIGRGLYRKVQKIQPVAWWNGYDEEPIDFRFPKSYSSYSGEWELGSEFGIEDCVEVFAGDLVLIAGASNYGKTAIALSLLGENLGLFKGSVLMGSEYTASDGKISPKFKRRMNRMGWVEWINGDQPRFQLYPVGSDYEDYVEPDFLNVIDWISLPGEYYLIDRVMKAIKDRVGNGVAAVVLQKNKNQEFGEGGERTERYADVVLTIDPYGERESLLTLGKVKSPKGKATGRTWAFSVVDFGANLHKIREVFKCNKCWGKGYTGSGNNYKRCENCEGKKYTEGNK